MKNKGIGLLILAFQLVSVSVFASDPLPSVRKAAGIGWTNLVGVPGGIPRRTTISATITAGASLATIQSAVTACASNSVVLLSAGTYNFGGARLNIFNNGVTLRGAGPGLSVIINTDYPSIQIGDWHSWETEALNNPTNGNHVNWTSGYAQGTTNITIASTNGYAVGQIIVCDQLNDGETQPAGNSQNGDYAAYNYTSLANHDNGHDRIQFQVNRIYAISGTNVTLREPLYMPNWSGGQTPQVWRFSTQPVLLSGIEDLETPYIHINNGYGCWISNVTAHIGSLTAGAGGCLRGYWTTRSTIEHCKYDGTVGIDNYGIETRACAGMLIVNNISKNVNTGLMPNGCSGSVIAYNVMLGQVPFFSVILQGLLQHGGFPNMNLYEGNYAPAIGFDNTWGGSAYNVAHRNRTIAHNPVAGVNYGLQYAFAANTTNWHAASIGNVLGTTGLTTNYVDYFSQGGGCKGNAIYYFGFYDVGCQTTGGRGDTNSMFTMLTAYNWTSAFATNSGIVNDGYTASDVPPTYYLTSKPSWFGFLAFPAVDPAAAAYSSSYTNIPAGYRDVYGVDPPAGAPSSLPVAVVQTAKVGTAILQ